MGTGYLKMVLYPHTMHFANPQNNTETQDPMFEVMQTPEIVVQKEKGAQLFSVLLKAQNPEWGETKTPLAKETVKYFKENPLNSEILEVVNEFAPI